MLEILKKIIPKSVFHFFQPVYHYLLALLGALIYRMPSRKLLVIGVTGTKGKSTTTEILRSIFESAGYRTAIQNTLRFKIADKEKRNLFKMSMPGRFFMQKFLRDAVEARCQVAILELTSEGAKQFRHKFIDLDALIFTNLAPEHIESHGSYENYVKAKLSIAKELEGRKGKSVKKVWPSPPKAGEENRGLFEETFLSEPAIIANTDDKEAPKFLGLKIKNKIPYSLGNAININSDEKGSSFQIGKVVIHSKLPGIFNVSNMIGAIACAKHFGITEEVAKKGIESLDFIRGRMEKIEWPKSVPQNEQFDIVIDYAHTPDSLRAVYEAYKNHEKICLLGNTGGGRDTWKRPEMGKIADQYCSEIILTNEDPYDEDPRKILEEMKVGIKNKPVQIIMDRRTAIRTAIEKAQALRQARGTRNESAVAVLITGKGTDPYIMEANGKKTPWDDASVAREELEKIIKKIKAP